MENIREEAREGGDGVTKIADNPVAQELLKAAKSLDGKLDFSSNAGRKQAVGEFVSLVKGKVDLPQNRNPKMEIGKLIMAKCSDKTGEEIMQVIFDKYGFADVKEKKAAAKEAAAEAACANPKNAALILAFGECAKVRNIQHSSPPPIYLGVLAHRLRTISMPHSLSFSISLIPNDRFRIFCSFIHWLIPSSVLPRQYYFAESNTNAALSYKKAISTLTELEEAVTEDNALSFSKGKTKLVGIGKATSQKMLEFVKTGTFTKLEEKRLAHA